MASPAVHGAIGEPFGVDIELARNRQRGTVAVRVRATFERAAA